MVCNWTKCLLGHLLWCNHSVVLQGTFLPLVVPPSSQQMILWSTWLVILCSLKVLCATCACWNSINLMDWNVCHIQMFQSLAKERLEQLNASPSATPSKYFRVYSAFLLVLLTDILWYYPWLTFICPFIPLPRVNVCDIRIRKRDQNCSITFVLTLCLKIKVISISLC